jgi:CheY-like chemotaxis protein
METGFSYRILIVDDSQASAKTLGWMVELMGHTPELAFGGKEAIARARSFKPDVILLDISLPDVDGYEVCRTLRREVQFKDTVFIAQTGWGQPEHRQRAKEAGFDHHLLKPVDVNTLQGLLESLAETRKEAQVG